MPDPRAVTRVLDEFLWTLRRSGIAISTAQAIDVARALSEVGLGERETVREAIACVVVQHARDRPTFDDLFAAFFTRRERRGTLWERLAARGFLEAELAELLELLERAGASAGAPEAEGRGRAEPLWALLERGADLDRLLQLAGITRTLDTMQSPLQAGFFSHRIVDQIGVPKAQRALVALRARLYDAFGARGDALADALQDELDQASEEVRTHVRRMIARRQEDDVTAQHDRKVMSAAFTSLSDAEVEEVRRAVRRFGERLRGGERVRLRRARRGRIDPHRMLRRMLATGGVPFLPARRQRRRGKPRLLLLCDVSDSVRTAARFMLEFVHSAHELFERTRSFVFVSDLGETTQLFLRERIDVALGQAYGGGVVSVTNNSNYGRVLRLFEDRHAKEIDRRTTVVILGDGRTNYHDDGADVLGRIRSRARALVWLCSEPRAAWAIGDCAMARYEPSCTRVLEVRSASELATAARLLVTLR